MNDVPSPSLRSTSSSAPPFDALIAPISRETFLSQYWNQSFLHLQGKPGRFGPVFTWDDLNRLLAQDLSPSRVRVYRDGERIDPSRYWRDHHGEKRLHSGQLTSLLAEGGTLIVDALDWLAPKVRELTESFQEALQVETQANLYASWGEKKGFDLHWDPQETIMLQLIGRKQWKVYRPTRLHPLEDDIAAPPKPEEPPVWAGLLEAGDLIYLPRGWWHVAHPVGEPCLHLTVTNMPPHGVDFLKWIASRLRRHATVRKTLPLSDDPALNEDARELASLVAAEINHDTLRQFVRQRRANIRSRPRMRFPSAPMQHSSPLAMQTRIRLASSHLLFFKIDDQGKTAQFLANGKLWECAASLVPALEILSDQVSVPLESLCARTMDPEQVVALQRFITVLAMAGVVLKEQLAGG